jgi:hypothetical protein
MTVFDLEDRQGVWFDMEGGGRVQLRALTAEDLKRIRARTVTKQAEITRVDGVVARVAWEDIDEELQNELFWDHCIVAWEKFVDSKGTMIPCTKANKVLLMTRSVKFARFVAEKLKELADDDAMRAEAAEKN